MNKKLLLIIIAVILLLLITTVFIVSRQKSAQNEQAAPATEIPSLSPGLPNESSGTNTFSEETPLPEGYEHPLPPKKEWNEPAAEKYHLVDQSVIAYSLLQEDTEALAAIRKIMPSFQTIDIGTSVLSSTATFEDYEIALFSGCVPHDCSGTWKVVAYDKKQSRAYLLAEKIDSAAGYVIFGNPPEEIKNLLIYYFLHQ